MRLEVGHGFLVMEMPTGDISLGLVELRSKNGLLLSQRESSKREMEKTTLMAAVYILMSKQHNSMDLIGYWNINLIVKVNYLCTPLTSTWEVD